MSHENLEAVGGVYASWAAGDFSASVALFDGDVVLVVDTDIPDGGTYTGRNAVREYMAGFLDPWESLTMAGESFTQAGDRILVRVTQRGIGRTSSAPVELRYFHVWTFRGDRVVRLEVMLSEERALEALR